MASEMTSAFRDFAMKKLSAAKQKGEASLVNATSSIASISSNVNVAAPASAASAAASFATSKLVSIGSNVQAIPMAIPKSSASAVEAAASFMFRSRSVSSQQQASNFPNGQQTRQEEKAMLLVEANRSLQKALGEYGEESLRGSINQVDAINESLAFTIENIQEAAHVMRMMTRQMGDLAHLQDEMNQPSAFYRKNSVHAASGATMATASSAAIPAANTPETMVVS